MKRFPRGKRSVQAHQRSFAFLELSRRRQRRFKMGIIAATLLAIAIVCAVVPRGRYVMAQTPSVVMQAGRTVLGLPTPRSEIDERWRRFRVQGIADSRKALVPIYENAGQDYQRLMRYAGLDPVSGLLRWGNYDRTLLLPSAVFTADDNGRSYRFRPCVDAIWLREITIKSGVLMFFLVPDGPGLTEAKRGTSAIPVTESKQSTNSWGLRGPEPEKDAPLRGIVLGDSFMQGMFIGDDETPPECLRRDLEKRLKVRASVLNTGHLGYSPEQYYYTLVEYGDRFRPHFVVVSVFANDFASEPADVVLRGEGDWDEAKYWLAQIVSYCASRSWTCLIVPAPYEPAMLGRRRAGYYPGTISTILESNGLTFLDPSEDLLNAHLELLVAGHRAGKRPYGCPLFNDEIRDGHFSAAGSRAWAETVGRRLALLLERDRAITKENQ
jgi:hypothetical protein